MKKLMLVVPICLLAVSGLYAQPISLTTAGKGGNAVKQTVKTPLDVPTIITTVTNLVNTSVGNTSPAAFFHRLGSGDFLPEKPTDRLAHGSHYTSGKAEMELPSVPPVTNSALEILKSMSAKELFSNTPSREVFTSALEQLGMAPATMAQMSDEELQELFTAHDILSYAARSTASRFEPEGEGAQKTLEQINWAKAQIDFFKEDYLREPYTGSFNPKAESVRVLMVVFSYEKHIFEMVQKKTYPNITLDFATIENAESMLQHNQYDIVLSGIGTYAFSLSMFAHNLGLDTPVIVYSFAPYWTSPYALYCYNIAGQIPSATSLAEAEGVINYLSNVVAKRRAKLGF